MQTVAEYLEQVIERSHLKQSEIAKRAGWCRPNFVTMLKQGRSKIPLSKVASLADALGLDRKELMIRCLAEYQPEVLDVLKISGVGSK